MVEIRAIRAESAATGSMVGDCVPAPGQYKGEPMRKVVDDSGDGVRIASYAHASKIETRIVAGVKVWPAYA